MSLRVFAAVAVVSVSALLGTACTATTPGRPLAADTATTAPVPSTVTAPSPVVLSDEDQIRRTMQAFSDAYNTQNWDAYRQQMCPAMRAQFTDAVMAAVQKTRTSQGLSRATVTEVTVNGDRATVTLEGQNEVLGNTTPVLPFVRADGWKICVVA